MFLNVINVVMFGGFNVSYVLLFFLSLPRAEERILVHVQPGAVPGILLDLRQHDGPTLHSWSRFVKHRSCAQLPAENS